MPQAASGQSRNGRSPRSKDPGPATHVREGGVEPYERHAQPRVNHGREREAGVPLPPLASRYLGGVHPRGAPTSVQLSEHQQLASPPYCRRRTACQTGASDRAIGQTACRTSCPSGEDARTVLGDSTAGYPPPTGRVTPAFPGQEGSTQTARDALLSAHCGRRPAVSSLIHGRTQWQFAAGREPWGHGYRWQYVRPSVRCRR